jgi:hypothetical protein
MKPTEAENELLGENGENQFDARSPPKQYLNQLTLRIEPNKLVYIKL